jgi:hypothetical protein
VRRAAVLWAIAACSDEVDLAGTYLVDMHVLSAPCGNDQPAAAPHAALVFFKGDLFGEPYFYYEKCSDPQATQCSGSGLFGDSFAEPIDGGWQGIITSSGGGGTTCTISFIKQTAILDGVSLVVEISEYAEQVENTPTSCAPEEADRRGTAMPCVEHERIEATKQ